MDSGKLLFKACGKNDVDTSKSLIDNGCDIEWKDGSGWTPLMQAAYHGNDGVIQLLIDSGCNIEASNNPSNESGTTALMMAAMYGNSSTVRLLVQNGANPNRKDENGKTVVDYARYNQNQIVDALKEDEDINVARASFNEKETNANEAKLGSNGSSAPDDSDY